MQGPRLRVLRDEGASGCCGFGAFGAFGASGFRPQASGCRPQASGFRLQASGFRLHASCVRIQASLRHFTLVNRLPDLDRDGYKLKGCNFFYLNLRPDSGLGLFKFWPWILALDFSKIKCPEFTRERVRQRSPARGASIEGPRATSERRGNTLKGFKDFDLKAKAKFWP